MAGAAEVLYAGGELESVEIVSGTPIDTNASDYLSPYARTAIRVSGPGDIFRIRTRTKDEDGQLQLTSVEAGDQFFLHFDFARVSNFNYIFTPLALIRDSAGNPWLKITRDYGFGDSKALGLWLYTGTGPDSGWSPISAAQPYNGHQLYTSDIRIALDVTGAHVIEWSINQGQVYLGTCGTATGTVLLPSWNDIQMADFSVWDFSSGCYFCELLMTRNKVTVGAHAWASPLDGAGTYSAWSGAYTDINETTLSDTTNLQTGTAGDKWTGTTGAISTPAGYVIDSVHIWTRARDNGVTPENLEVLIRSGGVDTGYAVESPSVSYTNIPLRLDTDPNGDLWTDTTWNAAERGVRAVA